MHLDELYWWFLGDSGHPRYVGELSLASVGKGVALRYGQQWLRTGFALSEDLPLVEMGFLPPGRLM